MAISKRLADHKDYWQRGIELSRWMEANGVLVDRASIPKWLQQEKEKDEARQKRKGKP